MWSNAKNGLVPTSIQERTSPQYFPRKRAIAGVEAAEEEPTETADTPSEEAPAFVPAEGKYRKRGTGYVTQLSANCWQGRYTPRVDGKRVSYNVYGATEAECEAKLAEKIKEVKAEMGRM